MSVLKPVYKTVRSIVISVILLLFVVYVGLYVLLSIPAVQDKVKHIACRELSTLLGCNLEIDRLSIAPFSEVVLEGVSLESPAQERCASISKVAAGIDMWHLLSERRIVFNYAEIIGFDASIIQKEKNGPLNIKFLIDALAPKDKTRPPKKFDLRFRNIIIRDSKAIFSRQWMKTDDDKPLVFSEIAFENLRMDLSIPTLKNDIFRFDIRNVQCDMTPGVRVRGLSADLYYKKDSKNALNDEVSVKNFHIELPQSDIAIGDIVYNFGNTKSIPAVVSGFVNPADFAQIMPILSSFDSRWDIALDAWVSGNDIEIEKFLLSNDYTGSCFRLKADASGIDSIADVNVNILDLKADLSQSTLVQIIEVIPGITLKVKNIIENLGDVSIDLHGDLSKSDNMSLTGLIETAVGILDIDGSMTSIKSKCPHIIADVEATDLELGNLTGVKQLGKTSFSISTDLMGIDKNSEGIVSLFSDYIIIGDQSLTNVDCLFRKSGKDFHASVSTDDANLQVDLNADCHIAGSHSVLDASLDLSGLNTDILGIKGPFANSLVNFNLDAHTLGNNVDNLLGFIYVSNLNVISRGDRRLSLDNLSLNIDSISGDVEDDVEQGARNIRLRSDWLDADFSGQIHPATLAKELKEMVSTVFPSLIAPDNILFTDNRLKNDFLFNINLKPETGIYDFFSIPISPLTDIPIKGFVNSPEGKSKISLATPHLKQGRDKLISELSFDASIDSFLGMAKIATGAIYPTKKGDLQLEVDLNGVHNGINANIQLNPTLKAAVKGVVAFNTSFSKIPNPLTQQEDLSVHVDIIPSAISVKETLWNVANGDVDYHGKNISVNNFLIEHDKQYVKIDGVASENPDDYLSIKLNDIDLDYIFNVLNINYVTFGGMATGEVVGSRLLTKIPVAYTKFLRVKNLAYNGAVLGDGDLASTYYPDQQEIGIYAVVKDPLTRERRANIDGGIWITRDSLSFTFDANKVNLKFMKPFVSAFCSDLSGIGSGKCKLFGSFKDIDLQGKLFADTVSMKIDFTNTWYHAGRDSVFMGNGLIDISPLTLYDSEGHTAELSGRLHHTYFHEPVFDFKIRNAKSLLCYDTNEKLNPLWYGTIYGSGSAQIAGKPGLVKIEMNMTSDENSKFYYVISDAEETDKYSFLSFTDKRKEAIEAEKTDTMPAYLRQFMQKNSLEEEGRSNVILSLKGSVTNDVEVTLIMDPVSGDKITARGEGALQMDYDMDANDFRMIGTYELDEGSYYFTLQDIIIKNFIIRQGSRIKFDGDPMDANLDIAATYRVNTNLTDLDKSFSTDKELNRTNVPVDAILLVDGPMTHPDINFDIELPTLTSDVERKVKSIVSTNDMLSRQIIYLLALNRFYTPEYTGSESNSGAEWSSMASSTISSQLSNILSNMTDKLNIAPSFRSDKGDFTDMEFDLALSSRLLNNRLLINGNFGYRDRQTSNTQFVGDFDIEYLLNKNGNLRLKAYNHFNDQNYYLRSALTTQGVGVVYRMDFDRIFKRKKKNNAILEDELLINSSEIKDSTSDERKEKSPMESLPNVSVVKKEEL